MAKCILRTPFFCMRGVYRAGRRAIVDAHSFSAFIFFILTVFYTLDINRLCISFSVTSFNGEG